MKKFERTAVLVALVTIILAWAAGALQQKADLTPFLEKALPGTGHFRSISKGIYAGSTGPGKPVTGYTAIGTASGYGGPMKVVVGLDRQGNIKGVVIVDHKETIPFFRKVSAKKFPSCLEGKNYSHSFSAGEDVDTVSGATLSLNALLASVRRASRLAAGDALNLPVKPGKKKPINFGFPEVILLLLFAAGFASYAKKIKPKPKKILRWTSRITGLLVLGFVFTIPLSLININSLLLGYLPDWHSHLYWYFLIVGILLPLAVMGKSPYCDTFCPFGAAQECLKVIGGAKQRIPAKYHSYLRWVQRTLAWAAVTAALFYRNPAYLNYEVFGTFFNLTGTYFQFGLLAVVLVLSLFITRPWCNYICPLHVVYQCLRRPGGSFEKPPPGPPQNF